MRGEHIYDWAWATLPAVEEVPAGFVRILVARCSVDDPGDIAYYLCFHPDALEQEEIVRVTRDRIGQPVPLRHRSCPGGLPRGVRDGDSVARGGRGRRFRRVGSHRGDQSLPAPDHLTPAGSVDRGLAAQLLQFE